MAATDSDSTESGGHPSRRLLTLAAVTTLAALAVVAVVAVVVWTGGDGSDDATPPSPAEDARTYPLPFGFEQVPDTLPLGRPSIVRQAQDLADGSEIEMISLRALYAVEADDPQVPYRAWVDQVASVTGGTPITTAGTDRSWAAGSIAQVAEGGGHPEALPFPNSVDLTLWSTAEGPLLLVTLDLLAELDGPGVEPLLPAVEPDQIAAMQVTVDEVFPDGPGMPRLHVGPDFPWPPEPADPLPAIHRDEGAVLFTEQGDDMHVPTGGVALGPTLPVSGGTGGSFTVVAASDGPRAVQELLDEARGHARSPDAVYDESDEQQDGVRVIRASFNISAGGWGFDLIGVQAPDDPQATLYIRSWAD